MDIATARSNYADALKAYEVSVSTFINDRKKITNLFFWGTSISLALFIVFFVFPPIRQSNTISDLRSGMDQFIVICLCAIGGIFCAWQARTMSGLDHLSTLDPESEKDFELAVVGIHDQLNQNTALIKQQKKLSFWSVGLCLVSDVMFILLMIAWAK